MVKEMNITWRNLLQIERRGIENLFNQCSVDEDGTIWDVSQRWQHLLVPLGAADISSRLAYYFEATGDSEARELAKKYINYARSGAVFYNGVWFWMEEPAPSLCSQGRSLRNLFYAALILDDEETLNWCSEFLRSWPYVKDEHRFVESFMPGIGRESNRGFTHPFNMVLEGAVDASLVGIRLKDDLLLEKGLDTIKTFFLPCQRADGLWDYRQGHELQVNYSLYCLVQLSHLLRYDVTKDLLADTISRSLQAVRDISMRTDGSVSAKVHWGALHIFESTGFYAYVAWMLHRYCGFDYMNDVARALGWLILCDTNLSPEFVFERADVRGEMGEIGDVIETLEWVISESKHIEPPIDDQKICIFHTTNKRKRDKIKLLVERLKNENRSSADLLEEILG